MDAFTLLQVLLPGAELTPGQLAQVRALNHGYYQRLYTLLQQRATDGAPSDPSGAARPGASQMAELDAALASDLRQMLTPTQQAVFDRNRATILESDPGAP